MMAMRFAGGVTVAGILGFIIVEALKILMVPVTAWVMGLLAIALKIVLISLAAIAVIGVIGLGVFVYRRSQKASEEF